MFQTLFNFFTISFPVPAVEGEELKLYKVSRLDMGAYMCIASNGVPPAVSKRIQLGIDCEISKDLLLLLMNRRNP